MSLQSALKRFSAAADSDSVNKKTLEELNFALDLIHVSSRLNRREAPEAAREVEQLQITLRSILDPEPERD